MLYKIVNRFPEDMIFKEAGPLVSLYQPTHRSFPDNKQDPIVYKNLLRDVEDSLKINSDSRVIESIMKPFYELQDDEGFWNNTMDGIAILASQNKCIVYNLHNTVKAFSVVANSFHIKPLLKAFQSIDNYQLLGLSRKDFSLYQGNRFGFQEIKFDEDVLKTMEDVLGNQHSESYLTYASHGGGTSGQTMFYGQSDRKEENDKDTEKYFRYVDGFVLENYSKKSQLPLILVGLQEYHSHFKSLSKNPYLLEEGINKSIESLDLDELENRAREMIMVINVEKIKNLANSYLQAEAESLGSSDLALVAKAAYEGRVKTILIEEDKIEPGKIEYTNGRIKFGDIDSPELDDILDDLAELVLLNGGNVLILTKENMPTTTGIAAIYRYN